MGSVTVNTRTVDEWEAVQEWVFAQGGSWAGGQKTKVLRHNGGLYYGTDTVIRIGSDMVMTYANRAYAKDHGWAVITYRMFMVNRGILSPSKTISSHMGMILDREEVKIVEKFSEALIIAVDDLGRIREQMKQLKEDEEVTKKKIQGFQLALGEYAGNEFKLSVTEAASAELDNEKTLDFLGQEKFLKVIRVIKKEAEQYMSKEEMDTCSGEPTITRKLTTRRLKK